MRKKILLMLVIVILTGCNGFFNDTISQPEGKVIVDGEHYVMLSGDYEWNEDKINISTKSNLTIDQLAEQFKTLEVDKGDTLKFEIEKDPLSTKVTRLNEDGTSDITEMKENEIIVPSESGYYIYQLETVWPTGKITFVFDLNVE